MDFTHPDAANPAVLNAILWRDRKGDQPMPAAQHKVFPDKTQARRRLISADGPGRLVRAASKACVIVRHCGASHRWADEASP